MGGRFYNFGCGRAALGSNRAKNPFLTNAGFYGAIEHLVSKLISKCAENKSFEIECFKKLLDLPKDELLLKAALKNLEGKSQRKAVVDYLASHLLKSLPDQDEYRF